MIRSVATVLLLALFAGPAHADEKLNKAEGVYKQFCSHCHGIKMVNPGTSSFDLRKFPTEQHDRFLTSVTKGKGDMPAWGDILLPDELDLLWYYVATRAGKQPFPDAIDKADSAAPDAADEKKASLAQSELRVCLASNGGVMSSRRHNGGVGLDYGVAKAVADKLDLPLSVTWFESEQDEESDPIKEVSALMSHGLCDLVPGVSLSESSLRPLDGQRAALPRWPDRPANMGQEFQIDISTLIMTVPYARVEMGLVLARDALDGQYHSLADLAGQKVGIEQGSLSGMLTLQQAGPRVIADAVTLPPGPAFLWRMETGAFDAALVTVPSYDFHARQNTITELVLADYRHPVGYNIAMASLSKDAALIKAVNAALGELEQAGDIARIAEENEVTYAAPKPPMVQPRMTMRELLSLGQISVN